MAPSAWYCHHHAWLFAQSFQLWNPLFDSFKYLVCAVHFVQCASTTGTQKWTLCMMLPPPCFWDSTVLCVLKVSLWFLQTHIFSLSPIRSIFVMSPQNALGLFMCGATNFRLECADFSAGISLLRALMLFQEWLVYPCWFLGCLFKILNDFLSSEGDFSGQMTVIWVH